jgi:hypothetical protein
MQRMANIPSQVRPLLVRILTRLTARSTPQVYNEAVSSDRCSVIHLTHVEAEPDCDTFFPDITAAGAGACMCLLAAAAGSLPLDRCACCAWPNRAHCAQPPC